MGEKEVRAAEAWKNVQPHIEGKKWKEIVKAIKAFSTAFGATGFAIHTPDEFAPTLRKAMETPGPVLIDIPVDYRHNRELGRQLHPDVIV